MSLCSPSLALPTPRPPPLSCAGTLPVLAALVKAGGDVNAATNAGRTPLIALAQSGVSDAPSSRQHDVLTTALHFTLEVWGCSPRATPLPPQYASPGLGSSPRRVPPPTRCCMRTVGHNRPASTLSRCGWHG